jgi:hypothetical protein
VVMVKVAHWTLVALSWKIEMNFCANSGINPINRDIIAPENTKCHF